MLLDITDFKKLVAVDTSTQDSIIERSISQAELLFLQPLLGSLYDEIIANPQSYVDHLVLIKPYLAYKSAELLFASLPYRMGNGGVTKPTSQHTVPESPASIISFYRNLSNRALVLIKKSPLFSSCNGELHCATISIPFNI